MSFLAEHLDGFPTFLQIDLFHNGQLSSISHPTGLISSKCLYILANKRSIDEGGNGLLGYTGYPKLRR